MHIFSLLTSAASVAVLTTFAVAEGPSDVLSLTAATFASTVNPEPLILVEFFAPWCGHCKSLAPHYEEAATALKQKNIKIAKVDCVDEADLCQSYGVQGYPTLKVFRNGTPNDYAGPRKADGIISYMIKQSLPAVSTVTLGNHVEFQDADKIVVIAYATATTEQAASEFSAVAEKYRDDYLFGLTTDQDAIAAAGVTPPAFIVYRRFDEPRVEYPYPVASVKAQDLEEWIKDLSVPILDEVSSENYNVYVGSNKPLAYLFLDPTDEKKEEHIAAIKPIAEQYKSKMNFVWIDAIKFGDHAKALNLDEAKWPSFVIQQLSDQLKFPYPQNEDVTVANVGEWVKLFLDGKLEPQLKSQPIPEHQDENVFTLVGKQFEEVVFDDSKDVFVEFYAAWCGHCKRLKPTWDSLGDHFANVKDRLLIAKIDSPENDLPPSVPFRVSGFPTIKLKLAGTREWLDYEGDRSLESLIAFVEENVKNSLQPQENVQAHFEANKSSPVTESITEEHDEL